MKIVFVYPAFESLAIEYLSAIAKAKGHSVSLVFDPRLFNDSFINIPPLAKMFSMSKRVADLVAAREPDLVAFSIVTSDYLWFQSIGGMIRRKTSAPIIAGNIHATSAPEEVLKNDFVNAIVMGEGESVFGDLLDGLSTGEIDPSLMNLGVKTKDGVKINPVRPLIENLDELPFPDKTIYSGTSLRSSDVYTIMAVRGCPFTCSFCNNNLMKKIYGVKGYVRQRSVDNVIEELSIAVKKYGAKNINFYDEVFGSNKKWLEEFVEKYCSKIGLPYIACTNPNIVTEEYARLLKKSGCEKIDLGVQTINAVKRKEIYHRSETNEQIEYAINELKRNKIVVAAENIINFPGETEADLVEMTTFYNNTRPDILKVFWLRYFPGTEIIDIGLREGVLKKEDIPHINAGRNLGSVTLGGKAASLQKRFYLLLMLSQIFRKKTIERIIDKKLYRYFPISSVSTMAYTFFRVISRKSRGSEIMLYQHAGRYLYYVKRFLTGSNF